MVGQAVSVVAVVRQPLDVEFLTPVICGCSRAEQAANSRFPPWKGLAIGLTGLVLTPKPSDRVTTPCSARCSAARCGGFGSSPSA